MAKRKRTNNDLQKTTQKTKDRVAWTPLKTGIERMYSTRNTRRVTLVTKPVICHEWRTVSDYDKYPVVISDTDIP
jgi:hypothetical protein